ncbi:expressed unknown protein [Seminavis robusta]|uniref:Uncharacterized protein n=1 Tax=Seminavis robusta TaxID=568900 RepID=A0A9N8F3J7_9STRA|nr:expressed unknown protein [Seminavis robusta]|eukprot:Sro2653_g333740.1 n/a (394) ;mRNA; r:890-2155
MSIPPRRVIKEERPEMRSVRIQPAAPSMAPPMPMPFGGRTNLAHNKTQSPQSAPATTSGTVNKAWKISQLRPVPSFYRLERTHLKIADASVTEIAARIADCLREESVYAVFDDDEAMVEAETHEAVTFTTRLFAGDGKVIVELQREAGCCFLFQQTARTVLRAAKGMKQANTKRRACTVPAPTLPRKSSHEEEKESLESGLELAAGLLKKDRLDAHLLAMESLSHLSRSAECECLVAKAIVCGPLLETLVSLIECWSVGDMNAEEEEKGEMEEQHCATMHRLAIAVLANCLNILEAQGQLDSVLTDRREQLCAPSFLMALVTELRSADQRPHDASEAARCLQPLVRCCPECKPRLMECDGLSAAAAAHSAGAKSHATLEKECHLLKIEITNCN